MKQTVYFSTFQTAFESIRPNNFTYEGLSILFDYLEELEKDCGIELELDVIGLCCDYSEDDPQAIADSYDVDLTDPNSEDGELLTDEDEIKATVIAYLEDEGVYIGESDSGIIYRNF